MTSILFDDALGLWLGDRMEGAPYRSNKKGVFFANRKAPVTVGLDLRTAKAPESVVFTRAPSLLVDGKAARALLPNVIAKPKCMSCRSPKLGWAEEPGGQVACLACGGMFDIAVFAGDVGYPVALSWAARLEGKWGKDDEKAVIEARPTMVSSDGAQAMKAAIVVARACSLRGFAPGKEIDDPSLAAVGEQKELRFLRLWYSPKLTAEGFAPIAKYTELEELNIGNNRVLDGQAMKLLAKMKKLKRLNLEQTKVGDEGLTELAKLPALEELALNSAPITDDGLAALSKHQTLRVVRVGWTEIGPRGLAHLAELPKLEVVETFDCEQLPSSKRGRLSRDQVTA